MYPGTTVTGLAVGDNGTILWYDGTAWRVVTTATMGATYMSQCRVGTSDYYIVGSGSVILHSRNPSSAASWQPETSPAATDFYTCGGPAANRVYASGLDGVIVYSTGNGTWTRQTSGTTNALRALAWTSSGEIWLTGGSLGSPGIMLRSTGNGTWTPVTFPGLPVIRGLRPNDLTNPGDIFGVGASGSIMHYNGSSWSPQSSGTTAQLNHIAFRPLSGSAREWWIVGNGGVVLHGVR
jgi:photosystem II stability/assembly factor-like uncharacterized protein